METDERAIATEATTDEPTQDGAEPDADATAADEAAAFAEGFGEETAEQPPETEQSTAKPTPEPASTTPPAEAGAAPAQPAEEEPPQFTKNEAEQLKQTAATVEALKQTIDRQFGTAFGKMGGIERTIREIQSKTPAGEAITFAEDDFAELKEEFPDLVGTLVKGLNRKAAKLKGTGEASDKPVEPPAPSLDPAQVDELVNQRVEQALETAEFKRIGRELNRKRPDWHTVTGDPDSQTPYRHWLAQQPEAERARILNSMDAEEILESITQFETETKKPPAAPPAHGRRDRLRDAVAPRGSGTPPPQVAKSEQEAFVEGFRS